MRNIESIAKARKAQGDTKNLEEIKNEIIIEQSGPDKDSIKILTSASAEIIGLQSDIDKQRGKLAEENAKTKPNQKIFDKINKKIAQLQRELNKFATMGGFERLFPGVKKAYLAEGGRIGYAEGTTEEEVKMTETVVDTPGAPTPERQVLKLSYSELRNKLPKEISDDIVELLANSTEALQDFAYITTQDDVSNFNVKYGVNLVIPQKRIGETWLLNHLRALVKIKLNSQEAQTFGFTDYLLDVPVGAVKGLSQAVQGLLSLGAMPIDYLANTDLLNGINDLFDKITPDTKTAVGDITSVIAQFGVPFGAAVKIAGGITKLKGISTMTQLGSLPTKAAKGTELVKRAGYYGTLGGLTDFAVSTPGKLGTISDLTGLTEQTDFEGLTGKDRAVEELKGKLKFGAEGAIIGGAVPLLPTAASLGFRYGIVPGAKVVGTVGGRALEYVVDKPLTFAINRIVGSKEKVSYNNL